MLTKAYAWLLSFIPVRKSRYDAIGEAFTRACVRHHREMKEIEEKLADSDREKTIMQATLSDAIYDKPMSRQTLSQILVRLRPEIFRIGYIRHQMHAYIGRMEIGPARSGAVESYQLQMREIRLTVGLDHDCPPEFAARQMAEELERFILREYRAQSLLLPQPGASNDLRRSDGSR